MTIKKILVVDDSQLELLLLTELLQERGFIVRSAIDGNEAMKKLKEELPDLILMDVVLPGDNGFQLTRCITRTPEYAGIPVIMCTGKNQETDRVWGMRQGARDYITKPIDALTLLEKIKALG